MNHPNSNHSGAFAIRRSTSTTSAPQSHALSRRFNIWPDQNHHRWWYRPAPASRRTLGGGYQVLAPQRLHRVAELCHRTVVDQHEVRDSTPLVIRRLCADPRPGLVRALQIGVAPTTGSRQSLSRLSESFPRQPLGALARRALGLYDVYGETTASATQVRGAELLTDYLKAGVAVYDADYIALSIARGYHLAGNEDLAREWIYYLLRNYPDSIRVRPEDPLITYYFYNPAKFASEVPWYMLKEPWKIPMAPPPTDLRLKEVKQ